MSDKTLAAIKKREDAKKPRKSTTKAEPKTEPKSA